MAKASKDRTGLFMNKPEFVINSATGKKLILWCNEGTGLKDVQNQITHCETVEELRQVYKKYPALQAAIMQDIMDKKSELELAQSVIVPNNQIVESQTQENRERNFNNK